MPTKANSEKPSKIEPDPSPNAKTKHRENAVDSGINLGFARYGHPDGTVYLPSDRKYYDTSAPDACSKHSPTWGKIAEFWDQFERGDQVLQAPQPQPQPRPQQPTDPPEPTLTQKLPFAKFALAYAPSDVMPNVFMDLKPVPKTQSTPQPEVKDLAVVVCVPSLTVTKVAPLLKRYEVDYLAFMPFRAKPVPFECRDKMIIIQLGFPRRPVGLWLFQEGAIEKSAEKGIPDVHYRKGHIRMDSLLLHIKEVAGIPTILSFAHCEEVAESMKMTFENNYWKPRFQDPQDRDILRRLPLPFFWYVVRRWDEVSEAVETFIGSFETTFGNEMAQRLHVLRAHILHSEGLLIRFKSILTAIKTKTKDTIVIDECEKLFAECERLEFQRRMHEERAKHIIDIMYNHSADRVAEASARDSRDMMQVSRLTMLFLPASVMAGVFGINSAVFNAQTSLIIYLILTIPLTVVIIWVFVAMQVENYFRNFPRGAWYRALWPYYVFGPLVEAVDASPV